MPPLILMDRELPLEAMHPLVDAAGKSGATAFLKLLRDVARDAWKPTARGEAFFIAWDKSVVVGVVALVGSREVGAPLEHTEGTALLRGLFVKPDIQRRGLGRALVERALRHAATSYREVRIRDSEAHHAPFYSAVGFTRGTDRSSWSRACARQ